MGRAVKGIYASRISSIGSSKKTGITILGTVDDGPAAVTGRPVDFYLDKKDVSFILATLARMPAYRHVFRAIADELDRREEIASAPSTAPIDSLKWGLCSMQTSAQIRRMVVETVDAAAVSC